MYCWGKGHAGVIWGQPDGATMMWTKELGPADWKVIHCRYHRSCKGSISTLVHYDATCALVSIFI